jgi:hypothetical protein
MVFCLAIPAEAQWTRGGAGRAWVKTAAFWQRTEQRFNELGERNDWFGAGRSDARALFTDVIVGIHPRLDIWVQAPYFDLRFDNSADSLRTTGFGDLRAWLRWNFATLGNGSTPMSLRLGAKAPIGSSPLDAQIIPVGDGQWDLETFAEVGHSFWPFPAYGEIWLGYRLRSRDDEKLKDPGDEIVFLAEFGVNPSGGTLLKATFDGFVGGNWVVEGVETGSRRRITSLQVTGGAKLVRQIWTEIGVKLSLAGRNFPAGPQFVVGFSTEVR